MNKTNNSSLYKNLKYILVLLGVVALVLSYFFVFTKYNKKTEDIQEEIDILQDKCDDLEVKNKNKANIEMKTKEAEEKYETILKKFDGGITYQSQIMDNYNMGQRLQIQVSRLSMASTTPVYTFGQLATSNPNGGIGGVNTEYSGVSMAYTIATVGTYDQMKQTLNYIMNEEGKRKVPNTITFAYDSSTQQVSMSINITEYAVSGGDRVQKEVEIPDYVKSTTNVFYNEAIKVG